MKRAVIGLLAIVIVIGASALAGEAKKYGSGVTLESSSSVAQLLAAPEKFVGKKVRVDGVVTAVCAKRGCWMMITDPEREQGIRIKVEDGVIVFPMEAMGRKASAEGIFEVVNPAGDRHEGAQPSKEQGGDHSCAEQEKAAKKASATYQIAGTGAVVYF